ncbi:hypothetical protein TBLA_0C01420 [Henningerozyma blattae CBS 6284]|uniref:Uncharacterized protein n=1 Tax=Henningerozyma blattae (strain ATCC 34711 / CBS 6284 / DSM 70876 / NBRC 10599 / NRRL Y-10934 / UCD 77-7) TaxID=1071380 RepID=I2H0Q5_HENB6|nr:hypothetical protein TBLA_0C01420 [Tetrapisispora blattae CBS 6284]CCH59957.1 hypothetical protein TBLA_0C01420 [Tetrapisispora blattae CBS 6284]
MKVQLLLVAIIAFFSNCINGALLGIDYGSKHLKAMVVAPQAPLELVLTPQARRKDISGLVIRHAEPNSKHLDRIYGSEIGSLSTRFPGNTFLNLKYLLGASNVINEDIYSFLSPGVELVETNRNSVAFVIDGVEYPLEELVSMNIQEIINRSNLLLSEKTKTTSGVNTIDKLAITIPEYFKQTKRQALLDIGEMTTDSLDTVVINDGMSIALNFALKNQNDFTPGEIYYYIIYDMGSSSTRSTLISVEQPLNTSEPMRLEFGGYGYQDQFFNGDFITLQTAELIKERFFSKHSKTHTKEDLANNPKARAKIIEAAEKAKLILSANNDASISIESLLPDLDFRSTIKRSELENLLEPYKDSIIQPIKDSLFIENQMWNEPNSCIELANINGIIMAGGSTRVPFVQKILSQFIDKDKILKNINADEAAVNGVTIRGIKLLDAFKTKPIDIVDHSIYNYSIVSNDLKLTVSEGYDHNSALIFKRGTTYPNKTSFVVNLEENKLEDSYTITTVEDNNSTIDTILITTKNAKKNSNIKKCPNGVAFNFTFELTKDRLFNLYSVDAICNQKDTNNTSTSIALPFTITKSQVRRLTNKERNLIREKITLLNKLDAERFEFQESLNILESRLYDIRSFLDDEQIISKGPAKQLDELTKLFSTYLKWLEEESIDTSKVKNKKDVIKMTNDLDSLKKSIEFYIKSSNEPLDTKQFEKLLEKSQALLDQIKDIEENSDSTLVKYKKSFINIMKSDIHDEFSKIKLPRYLTNALSSWNSTYTSFIDEVHNLENILKKKILKKMAREELFDIKTSIDDYLSALEPQIAYFDKAIEYKLKEIESSYQRKLRVLKRKEERQLKKLQQQNSTISNGTVLNSTVPFSTDNTETVSATNTKRNNKASSPKPKANKLSSSKSSKSKDNNRIINDEL